MEYSLKNDSSTEKLKCFKQKDSCVGQNNNSICISAKPIKVAVLSSHEENESKSSSLVTSVLDQYCKINTSLDESSDFIKCDIDSKLKSNSKDEILCEICKDSITHLDLKNREMHVNSCIDKMATSQPENVFILECPLCFKQFSSMEFRSSHIKKCGKSKGLSLQSILKAIELQERHALERMSLGLPAKQVKSVKLPKKPVYKRALEGPKSKADSDMQLARALSLSLTNSVQPIDVETVPIVLKPPTHFQRPGKKTKAALMSTPLLIERSEERRKQLLLEKVATIVTPVDLQDDVPSLLENIEEKEEDGKNDGEDIIEVPTNFPTLWFLSSKASENSSYYVGDLLDWINPMQVAVGAKLCHLSQIPGHEIVTQQPCDYTFSSSGERTSVTCVESGNSQAPSIMECLQSLVASSWMSDVDIQTICGSILPAHRLLLAARCPPLKQDSTFCSGSKKIMLKWETVSFESALQFLNFIYTGKIDVQNNTISDLFYLAKKYEVLDLQALLHSHENNRATVNAEKLPDLQTLLPDNEMNKTCVDADMSQEEANLNLDIVYGCINSSLKPSQSYESETSKLESLKTELLEGCEELSKIDTDVCKLDNLVVTKYKHLASPEVFDVNDSEDVSDDDLKMGYSQKSEEPHSTDSNSSHDTIKLLSSSSISLGNREENNLPSSCTLSKVSSPKILPVSHKILNSPFIYLRNNEENNLPSPCTPLPNVSTYEMSPVLHKLKPHNPPSETSSLHCNSKEDIQVLSDAEILDEHSDSGNERVFEVENINISRSQISMNNACVFGISEMSSENPSSSKTSVLSKYEFQQINEALEIVDNSEVLAKNLLSSRTSVLSNYEIQPNNEPSEIFGISEVSAKSLTPFKTSVQSKYEFQKDNKAVEEIIICNSDSDSNSPKTCHWMDENLPSTETRSQGTALSDFKMKHGFLESPIKGLVVADSNMGSARADTDTSFITFCSSAVARDRLSPCREEMDKPNMGSSESNRILLSIKDSCEASVSDLQYDYPYSEPYQYSECDDAFEENSELPTVECSKKKEKQISTAKRKYKSPKSTQPTINKKTTTPLNKVESQFQLSSSPITPLPDYKRMMTPEIKQALSRIGVKPLPRKKAVALLSHVYDETHPWVNGTPNVEDLSKKSKGHVINSKKRKCVNENIKLAKKQKEEIHSQDASQESDDSSSENPEWHGCVPEMSFSQFQKDSPTKVNKDDIESIRQYIESNEDLYKCVLCYKPLNVVEFHQELKNCGIKISYQKLMDFLDEQCITFTCPRKEEYRKKQTARTQRFRKNMIAKLSQQNS